MPILEAVLDTNVLISALRSKNGASFELLRRVGQPGWRLHLSTASLLEYEEIARRVASTLFVNFIALSAEEHAISFRWRPYLSDPDDDFVLELAIAAGAKYIITHNLRNFEGIQLMGVTPIAPAKFLHLLIAANP